MSFEDEKRNEEELRKKEDSKIEDKRRLKDMRQAQNTQVNTNQDIDLEKSVNRPSDVVKNADKSNVQTRSFDQVNADYKFVMNNLDKEKEAFQKTKQEKTPAMKKYEKFEKNMPQARRDMVERIKEKSLREANPQQKER